MLPHFTRPPAVRFVLLTAAAVLTTGRRTVANLLRTVGRLAPGHDASYRRVLSAARWSGVARGCTLTRFLLDHLVPTGPVPLVGDDVVDGHPGRRVYGKGRPCDPVRSSHAFTAWRYGHKWVVLAVLVRLPFIVNPARPDRAAESETAGEKYPYMIRPRRVLREEIRQQRLRLN